ncbi:hypothetical protein B5807_06997 [Epicoccum nigrum]|uniref:Acyl-CoA oxidase C-alpha1 domain-containing protein n=1 Tax=Epicoccum nigrum TaxID=105696 RepID=A0A1Y2LXE0_EPING|nr:hypothetical protein B5807_06997 [Epicoccum nigrum]
MLMGHSVLRRDGTHTADLNRAKSSYSVMLLVRGKMPAIFAVQLAQAVTIATRYSMVREQGLGSDNSLDKELTIISYKQQHFRILTLIAKSYAMFFAGQDCNARYADLKARQARGDHATLPSVHALCAGLKAYVTCEAVDGAEDARKLCGGHGYMSISGLPDLIGATAGGCTFEGENHVMWQQLGRYLSSRSMPCKRTGRWTSRRSISQPRVTPNLAQQRTDTSLIAVFSSRCNAPAPSVLF